MGLNPCTWKTFNICCEIVLFFEHTENKARDGPFFLEKYLVSKWPKLYLFLIKTSHLTVFVRRGFPFVISLRNLAANLFPSLWMSTLASEQHELVLRWTIVWVPKGSISSARRVVNVPWLPSKVQRVSEKGGGESLAAAENAFSKEPKGRRRNGHCKTKTRTAWWQNKLKHFF